jgi:hypothetical protein
MFSNIFTKWNMSPTLKSTTDGFPWKQKETIDKVLSQVTVIAIGCPTGTSFEPSGTKILARNLHNLTHTRTNA